MTKRDEPLNPPSGSFEFPKPTQFMGWLKDLERRRLNAGSSHNPCRCPFAMFLLETVFHKDVRVGKGWVRVPDGGSMYLLPPWAMRFIEEVDTSGPERPVSAKDCVKYLEHACKPRRVKS